MLGTNIGIDLGTTSIVIYVENKGIVLSEPCAAAYEKESGKLIAVGKRAWDMVGKNPESIRVVRPMEHGVVSDFTATRHILRYFLSKICKNMVFKPNVVVCVPSMATSLEKRTILDLITSAGAAKACLIEEPLAAALGAGLGSNRPVGAMIVDIGGGTTDIAVITMGCISVSKSIKVAGNALDEAIVRQIRRERDVIIGEKTAEHIKKQIGCSYLRDVELGMTVKGKHFITNLPVSIEVSSTEAYLAMRPHLETISEAVRSVLELTPPELSADIMETGIRLTGGGALLQGIDKMIEKKTGVRTIVSEDSLNCVALGTGEALTHMDILSYNGYVFKARDEIGGLEPEKTE
ncbi:MAG: rod shape-determining protein [Clostridia bacterium]|nr:rod shape-determining protein [Clostridia bacterium]MBQ3006241.1 rod shape-determining protein [Clostridia bacterium]